MVTGTRASHGNAEVTAVSRASTVEVSFLRRLVTSPQFALIVLIVLFGVFVWTEAPQVASTVNLINILRNTTFIFIIGCFTTLVLVSGGLDLSIGSVFLVGAMATASLLDNGVSVPLSILLGVGAGSLAGFINGVLINYVNIPSFIATLGMLYIARGIVVFLTNSLPVAPLPGEFNVIGQGALLGIPYLVFYAVVVGLFAHVLLEYSVFGASIRAVGGNREAAQNMGINVRRVSLIVYVLSGTSAGFAGMLMSARLGSGQPSLGQGMELQVISAVIIGGTSIFGAIGSIGGTVLGALVLSVLAYGLILLRINPVLQLVIVGCIILLAVAFDQLRRKRMFRTARRQEE